MSPERRTIIFVWNYLEWGGAQIYFLAIIKVARPAWDILVILPRKSSPDVINFLERLEVRYDFLELSIDLSPAPTLKRKIDRQLMRLRSESEVRRHLRKFDLRENILHIETAPWQSWLHLTALSRRGANIFVTMHNFMPRASRWRELVWNARLQYVSRLSGMHMIAANRDTRNRLKGWVSQSFWDSVVVAHAAIDPAQIDKVRLSRENATLLRRQHSIPENKTVVLAVGRFVDRKGRWVFLDAAAKLLKTEQDLFFVWVTPELPDADDRVRIDSYGINGSLSIVLSETLGKDREDILRFFNVADMFTLPSYIEGLPIALLEAMAIGIPSISTDVFAIPEAVVDGETGLLMKAGRSDQLALAIMRLKGDVALRRRLSEEGRNFVVKNFDERDSALKCLAEYAKCFPNGR
jgi:glycosyltransferase involved in cell wall biosynthesis